jgi:hypothetical protein
MKIAIYSHSIAPSIDGVTRRFTAILHELVRQGHETILFTFEENPLNIPESTIIRQVDYMYFAAYPDKKAARVTIRSFWVIYQTLLEHKPDVSFSPCLFQYLLQK